ncbi:MAG: ferritin-like domain-containing protein [Chloroflexota bacterium]|nr:ferritin-like domain-containing protein [Chloroflexota bacterium]
MRHAHLLNRIAALEAFHGPVSRRGLVRGSASLAGGAAALGGAGGAGLLLPRAAAAQQTVQIEDEVDVLNFALTLEHLDSTLYRVGLEDFDEAAFEEAGFQATVREYLAQIAENEATQVEFLTETISDLGGDPVPRAEYSFPYTTLPEFLALSLQVEEVGLDAYTGAAQYLIDNDELLTAALTIHAVEARHLAYFRYVNGLVPFPEAFEAPITPDEAFAVASQFIVAAEATPGS